MGTEVSQSNPLYLFVPANAEVADPNTDAGLQRCAEAERVLEYLARHVDIDPLRFDGPLNSRRCVPDDGIPVWEYRLSCRLPQLPDDLYYELHFVVQNHQHGIFTQLLLTNGASWTVDLHRLLEDARSPFSDSARATTERLTDNIWKQSFVRLAQDQ